MPPPRVNSDGGTLTLGSVAGTTLVLTVGGAGNSTIGGAITSTTGGLTKDGAGTLTLSAVSSYTGATTISVGTLALGIANAIGSSAVTVAAGAVFDLEGFSDTVGSLAGAGSLTSSAAGTATLTAGGNNSSTTYSGVASDGSGQVALTKAGTGTLTLSGTNTYTRRPDASPPARSRWPPTPTWARAPAVATPGQIVFSGGTLLASASFTLNANRGIALTGAGTLNVNSGLTLTYAGIIAGSGALTKAGTGTLTLSGSNTYSGSTTVTAGTLSIAVDNNLGTAPGVATRRPTGLQRWDVAGHRQLHAVDQPRHRDDRRGNDQRQRWSDPGLRRNHRRHRVR